MYFQKNPNYLWKYLSIKKIYLSIKKKNLSIKKKKKKKKHFRKKNLIIQIFPNNWNKSFKIFISFSFKFQRKKYWTHEANRKQKKIQGERLEKSVLKGDEKNG